MGDPFSVQVDDERTQLTAFVEEYRTLVAGVLDGLTEEQARRRLVPSATTLIGLVRHAAFVETVWFGMAVSGRSRAELGIPDTVEESFLPGADETVDSVRRHYLQVCERSRAAVAGLGLDDTVSGRGYPITVRWLLLQVLRELAHHCGHADILREQVLAAG
ncbi:DinB family protein [Pseudonocardia sp. DR1-2]|uniref:DinB family protein n=1 Tax=Pseudonocardia sp. DR1-2 TaxID=2951168 RepID=UPI0020446D5D|nr:DinB family protein [Pseudonocardia sp. DR1-2]MCM3846979.1 DinB family protein [Pseudonocardia sp. DR1-2]